MILKGAQRSGAAQLAQHLLNVADNEHVEVHELRGFMADDLKGALKEARAVSQGTRCKQFLFSVSLNPPETASLADRDFTRAAREIEKELGLVGQPRAIVFHEKEGRRHAHAVWSRIDCEKMRAINLPHFKVKLREVSRELYLKHGWRMPNGLVDSSARNPLNSTRAEWQQCKRAGQDPRALKRVFQDCWAISDSGSAFASALEERGYYLAQGDRRGVVAVDFRGEAYAVARYVGVRSKELSSRLGDTSHLPSVDQRKAEIAARMTRKIEGFVKEVETASRTQQAALAWRKAQLRDQQRKERERLRDHQERRRTRETNARAARLRRGLLGVWDQLTGRHRRVRMQNEIEARQAHLRDREEKQKLIQRQLAQRRPLQAEIRQMRERQAEQVASLHRDVAAYMRMGQDAEHSLRDDFRVAERDWQKRTTRGRSRRRKRGPGTEDN